MKQTSFGSPFTPMTTHGASQTTVVQRMVTTTKEGINVGLSVFVCPNDSSPLVTPDLM